MTVKEIKTKISEIPEAEQFLKRIVRHATTKELVPRRIVIGNDPNDKALFDMLNRLLSGRCFVERGKYVVKLPEDMREAAYWRPLVDAIGVEKKIDSATIITALETDTIKRLKIMFRDEKTVIESLAKDGTIRKFIGTDKDKATQYLKLFKAYTVLKRQECTTLSQLGSDTFNDSKALRSGSLLAQLDKILRTAYEHPDIPTAELHENCGIIDNPYTSHVIIFAPFSYITENGVAYDHPAQLFQNGEATILPWETVQQIREIKCSDALKLITSENAAPFLRLVRKGIPALYTEGYPNTSVRVLLRRFNEVGGSVEHFGDTDLDGYRIAEQISRIIPLDGLYKSERVSTLPHRELTEPQKQRLTTFIEQHPDFRFIPQLHHTLAYGWVEQEASGQNEILTRTKSCTR